MADRLNIYNGALRLLGQDILPSLTEEGPSRRALDSAWQDAGDYLLAKGLWNFALRFVKLTASPSDASAFGYAYVFDKPDDWVRTASITIDGTDSSPLRNYDDRAGYWLADLETIYVRYVSDDDDYGWNVGAWRQPFAKCFSAYLAFECGLPISNDKGNRNDLYTLYKGLLKDAKALDAVDETVREKPAGRLTRSRMSHFLTKDGI
jgi:hypothetical protein